MTTFTLLYAPGRTLTISCEVRPTRPSLQGICQSRYRRGRSLRKRRKVNTCGRRHAANGAVSFEFRLTCPSLRRSCQKRAEATCQCVRVRFSMPCSSRRTRRVDASNVTTPTHAQHFVTQSLPPAAISRITEPEPQPQPRKTAAKLAFQKCRHHGLNATLGGHRRRRRCGELMLPVSVTAASSQKCTLGTLGEPMGLGELQEELHGDTM